LPFIYLNHGASVHPDDLSVHPPALVAAQEPNDARDVLGRSQPPRRVLLLDGLDQRLWFSLEKQLRRRGARSNGVDGDSFPGQLLCQNPRELLDGALGGGVDQVVWRDSAGVRQAAAEENHPAAATGRRRGRLHVGDALLDEEQRPLDVDVEVAVVKLLGQGGERGEGAHEPRVGDYDVDAAEFLDGGRDQGGNVGQDGAVCLDWEAAVGPAEAGDQGLDFRGGGRGGAAGEDEGGAEGGEVLGRGEADAAGAAGD